MATRSQGCQLLTLAQAQVLAAKYGITGLDAAILDIAHGLTGGRYALQWYDYRQAKYFHKVLACKIVDTEHWDHAQVERFNIIDQ